MISRIDSSVYKRLVEAGTSGIKKVIIVACYHSLHFSPLQSQSLAACTHVIIALFLSFSQVLTSAIVK